MIRYLTVSLTFDEDAIKGADLVDGLNKYLDGVVVERNLTTNSPPTLEEMRTNTFKPFQLGWHIHLREARS